MQSERLYRNGYCLICKNRGINSDLDLICGLTNEVPCFEDTCNKYILDEGTYNKKLQDVKDQIKVNYNADNFYGRYVGTHSYKEHTKVSHSKYKTQKSTVGLKIFESNSGYLISLVISLFILFTLPIMSKEESSNVMIIFYIFLFLLSVYSIYVLIFKKKEIFLEVTQKSLIIKNEDEIFWNEIITTGITTINTKNRLYNVVIGTLRNDIIEIRMDNTNLSAEDVIRIIHLNVNPIHQRF